MAAIEGLGNLNRSGVKPLRSTAKARDQQTVTTQRFSVAELKKGGDLDLTGMTGGGSGQENFAEEERPEHASASSLRRGWKKVPKAIQAHKSSLPTEEQIAQLSQIRKSAIEYEAVLMDQFVKQMRQSPLAKTPGGDTFSDIAEQPFRDFLSQAGGLGLADSIVSQVARQQGLEQTLQDHPEIMGPGWRPAIPPNLMKKSAGALEIALENQPRQGIADDGHADGEPRNVTEPGEKVETEPTSEEEKSAGAGLMTGEEIAWLYGDALDGLRSFES